MRKRKDSDPAFPVPEFPMPNGTQYMQSSLKGMTVRQYAAIHLLVPNSGYDWLDDMIREARRNDFAAKAMAGIAEHGMLLSAKSHEECDLLFTNAGAMSYRLADAAMLAARGAA